MVSVIASPTFTSFSPARRSFHDSSAELNGVGLDAASEAESQEYYSHSHDDGAEAEYDGAAAGLLDAYGASPPSSRSRQTVEKQRPAHAEAKSDGRADVDEEQEMKERLAELQMPGDEQKESREEKQQDVHTSRAARGGRAAAEEKEQAISSTAIVGKKVPNSLLATATSVSRGRGKQATGGKSATRQQRSADEDDGASLASAHSATEQKEAHTAHAPIPPPQRERAAAAAEEADPFAFDGEPTSDGQEEKQQPATARKGKKSAGAGAARKASMQKAEKRKADSAEEALGAESATSETAERQRGGKRVDKRDVAVNGHREEAEQESIPPAAPAKATLRSKKIITTVSKAAADAAAATMRAVAKSDLYDFPAATEADVTPQTSESAAPKKKSAAASKKKKSEKGGQRARRQDEDTQAAAEADGVVDEAVDGGDVADTAAAEYTAAHLDGYCASPPSEAWLKRQAAKEKPRKAKREVLQDEQRMDDGEQQADADMADGTAEQQDEQAEAAMDEEEAPVEVKSETKKKRGKKSALPAKKKVAALSSKKKGGSTAKQRQKEEEQRQQDEEQQQVEADGVDVQEPQEGAAEQKMQDTDRGEQHVQWVDQAMEELEQQLQQQPVSDGEMAEEEPEMPEAQESDVYDFSSSGADEQPKPAARSRRSAATSKRAEPAARERKGGKKTGASGGGKRRKSSSSGSEADDMSDVFDATARELGLQRESYDENDARSPALAEQADEAEDDAEPSEPVVLAPPAKKRRSGRSRAPAVTDDEPAAADSDGANAEAALACAIAAYAQQVDTDVQSLTDRAHNAHKQHTKEISAIQAELKKSPHSRTQNCMVPPALLSADYHCSYVHDAVDA